MENHVFVLPATSYFGGYCACWLRGCLGSLLTACLLHGSITAIMEFWVTTRMMGLDSYLAGNSEDGLHI